MITEQQANDKKESAIKYINYFIERAEKLERQENDQHHARLKQIKTSLHELVNYYQKQIAFYEQQASHARILRLCLTGMP